MLINIKCSKCGKDLAKINVTGGWVWSPICSNCCMTEDDYLEKISTEKLMEVTKERVMSLTNKHGS